MNPNPNSDPGDTVWLTTSADPESSERSGGSHQTRADCVAEETEAVLSSGHWTVGGVMSTSSGPVFNTSK